MKELERSYGISQVDTLNGLQLNPPSTSDFPLPLHNTMVSQTWLEDNKFLAMHTPFSNPALVGYVDSAYYIGPNSVVRELIRLGIEYPMTRRDASELFVWHNHVPDIPFWSSVTAISNLF